MISGKNTIGQALAELGPLWCASLYRFFYLEDIMRAKGWTRILHAEGDNPIYRALTPSVIGALAREYTQLAYTKLSPKHATAAVLWVNNLEALSKMNTRLLDLMMRPGRFCSKMLQAGSIKDVLKPLVSKHPRGIGAGVDFLSAMEPNITIVLEKMIRTHGLGNIRLRDAQLMSKEEMSKLADKEAKRLLGTYGFNPSIFNEMVLLNYLHDEFGSLEYGYLPMLPPGISEGHPSSRFAPGGPETASSSSPIGERDRALAFAARSLQLGLWDAGPWGIKLPLNFLSLHSTAI